MVSITKVRVFLIGLSWLYSHNLSCTTILLFPRLYKFIPQPPLTPPPPPSHPASPSIPWQKDDLCASGVGVIGVEVIEGVDGRVVVARVWLGRGI